MNFIDSSRTIPNSKDTNTHEIATVAYTSGDKIKNGLLSALSIFGRIVLVLSRDGKQNDLVITGKYSYNGKEYNAKVNGDCYDYYFSIPQTLVEMVEEKNSNNRAELNLV